MWCAPAIFVQFFWILLLSSVLVLGFTYRALEHYRILDYVTRVIIPLFKWWTVENRFLRFQQKVAQGISRLRFQLWITFVLDYRFIWNKRQTKLKSLVKPISVQICFKTFIFNLTFRVQRLWGFYWDKLYKSKSNGYLMYKWQTFDVLEIVNSWLCWNKFTHF